MLTVDFCRVFHSQFLFSFFVFATLSSSKFEKRNWLWKTFVSNKTEKTESALWAWCSHRFFHCLTNFFQNFDFGHSWNCPISKKRKKFFLKKIKNSVVSIMLTIQNRNFQFVTEIFFYIFSIFLLKIEKWKPKMETLETFQNSVFRHFFDFSEHLCWEQ